MNLHLFACLFLLSIRIFFSSQYSDIHPKSFLCVRHCLLCQNEKEKRKSLVLVFAFHHVGNEANLTDKSWSISNEQTDRSAVATDRKSKTKNIIY